MKKMTKDILMLACASLILICCAPDIKPERTDDNPQKEEEVVPEGMMKKQFTASVADMTKASLVGTAVRFSASDKIAVYDGTLKNEFSVKSIDGGYVIFEGLVTKGSDEFYAMYPYSKAPEEQPQGGVFSLDFPQVQKVDKSSPTDADALISLAVADKVGHLQFRNVASMIVVSVPGGAKKVTITAIGDGALSGACTVTAGEVAQNASIKSVTLLPSEEGAGFSAGDYNVCTLPVHLQDGLVITYEDDAQRVQVTVDSPIELSRTSQLDLTDAAKDIVWIRNFIHDADELREFAKVASGYGADELVGIADDIDLGGESWTPFNLSCTLDGMGHKISGINVTTTNSRCGFIGTLQPTGVLKNIILGSVDGNTYDGTSAVTYTGTAAAYQGGVVSDCLGTLQNVKSFMSVNHSSNDPGNRIGGLVGNINQNGRIIGCEYAGTMTLANNNGSATHMAGGIAGRMHNGLANAETIKDTKFTGVINNTDQKMEAVGGFVGIMQGGSIVDCESSGVINMDYNNYYSYAGGFVGFYQSYASAYTSQVSGCVNSTVINSTQRLFAASGIVAYVQRGSTGALKVDGCTNNADIKILTAPTGLTCLGGIVGLTQDVSGDVMKVKLTVTNNVNNGKIDMNIAGANAELRIGGIAGYLCGTVAFEIGGNVNNGAVIGVGKSISAGGIVARLSAPGTSVNANVNKGEVNVTSTNQWSLAGGIVGYSNKNLGIIGSENHGDVVINSTVASDNYAAGIIGQFVGSSDTNNRCVLNISDSKSLGAISSPGRAGVIFSALGGGTYVNCNLDKVGVGGSKNGTAVTAENYGSHLWSYTNNTYHAVSGSGTCYYAAN